MDENRLLRKINSPADLRRIPMSKLPELAAEIRRVLISTVSLSGGHLASNLGVVELTIALHRVFDSPRDKIIFDVGHQCYTHKLLTGRYKDFSTLRREDGLSGFLRPYESEHDIFFSGHSSTALSAAFGIAEANKISGRQDYTVAVVGDGAFTGGEVYEAMNNAGRADIRLIVILNDNEMSISKNVGALARYFAVLKADPKYFRLKARTEEAINRIPVVGRTTAKHIFNVKTRVKNFIYDSTMFEELGFRYIGPIDGHDIPHLCSALEAAKEVKHYPVLIHVKTVKGKGYDFAEKDPSLWHGVSEFDIETGQASKKCGVSFSSQFGKYMVTAAAKDKRICAITAAMAEGTGLAGFSGVYPDRFFDTGIAEAHAVTFASGLARGGMLPVFAVYSSFLQRAYDQVLHDAALQGLKVVFVVDRAGFVGMDGETHQGLYDAAFLNTIPGITVLAPSDFAEMNSCLDKALYHTIGPVAVRIPRGCEPEMPSDFTDSFSSFDIYGDPAPDTAIVTYGRIFANAAAAKKTLADEGIDVFIIKLNSIKPIDGAAAAAALGKKNVIFFEEGQRCGGIGESFLDILIGLGFSGQYHINAVDDCFVPQASVQAQLIKFGLDADGMAKTVRDTLSSEVNDGKDKA